MSALPTSQLKPCRACGSTLLLWKMPSGPLPEGMLIDGIILICEQCANIQVSTRAMAIRDLTREEREQIQPGPPSIFRDKRWQEVKDHHDQIVKELTERMSR